MVIRTRWALAGAAGCFVLLLVTWFAAFHIGFVRSADQSMFGGFYELSGHSWIYRVADHLAPLCDPSPYVYFAAVPIVVALLRGRPRVAVAVGVILLGANLTTHILKPLLEAPREASYFGWTTPVFARHVAKRPCHGGDVVGAVDGPRRPGSHAPGRGGARSRCSRSRSATRSLRSAGISRATCSEDSSSPRRGRCWRSPGCWPSKRGAPAASARSIQRRSRGRSAPSARRLPGARYWR